jgi:translation initiation factor 2B subunit (eIF-2B alpha/beta/delta family)
MLINHISNKLDKYEKTSITCILKFFHSSVSLYVDTTKNNNNVILNNEDIKLNEEVYSNMKEGLKEFKEEVSKIREEEIIEEMNSLDNYLGNTDNNNISDEMLTGYVTNKVSGDNLIDENTKEDRIVEFLNEVKAMMEKCKENGLEKECLEQIQISKVGEKVFSNEDGTKDVKELVENLIVEQINKIAKNEQVKELFEKV